MIIGFTGHRKFRHPEKKIAKQLILFLTKMKPDKTISGMALGFDQLAARVCVYLGIPFIAAVPAKEQPNFWPLHAVKNYFKILEKADEIVYVDKVKGYSNPNDNFITKLFNRNHWMVDHSDKMIAYYLNTGRGGTAATVRYAVKQKKLVIPMEIR
jgi:uncharacterized phage-like protein YoqJ